MSGPIINPIFFYWLDIVSSLDRAIFCLEVILAILGIAALVIIAVMAAIIQEYPNNCESEKNILKYWQKILKIAIGLFCLFMIVGIFIPSKETLLSIMVAKFATYENAAWTLDTVKSAVDYIIEAISNIG